MTRWPHLHFCADCRGFRAWRWCEYRESCVLPITKMYPCLTHMLKHVIFVHSTPEAALADPR